MKVQNYADNEDEAYIRTVNKFTGTKKVPDYNPNDNANGVTGGVYTKFRRCLDVYLLKSSDDLHTDVIASENEAPGALSLNHHTIQVVDLQ